MPPGGDPKAGATRSMSSAVSWRSFSRTARRCAGLPSPRCPTMSAHGRWNRFYQSTSCRTESAMAMRFHDRHEWIDYLKACEVALRIGADPSVIADAQRFVAEWMLPDPHQRDYAVMWQELLSQPPETIAAALAEDSPRGRLLRETRPVFGKGL